MLTLRLPDAILMAVLVGLSAVVYDLGFSGLAVVVAVLTGVVAWGSTGTAQWIRDTHVHAGASVGTAIRNLRKPGAKLPPPYCDAWFAVALSDELPPGELRSVTICNRNLVVWRPASDKGKLEKAVVFDAYCPHLGANLALGGASIVSSEQGVSEPTGAKRDCLRCPFHGWKFSATGECVEAPGSATCPSGPGSSIASWPVKEKNGVISVWMGAHIHRDTTSQAKDNKPWFDIPRIPELNHDGLTGKFDYAGFTENTVPCHMLEIPENGSDVAHLPALHAPFVLQWLRPVFSHFWEATWKPHEEKVAADSSDKQQQNEGPKEWGKHIADITIEEAIVFAGKYELPGRVKVKITQAGPSQVYLQMRTPIGPITLVETVTPVHPLQQRVLHACYIPKWMPMVISKVILWATLKQFEADVPIWTQKRYEPKPFLSGADKGIPAYRRWVTQFYDPKRGDGSYTYPPAITFAEAASQYARDLLGLPAEENPSALINGGNGAIGAVGGCAAENSALSW
jgi:cholesterol 7-desaturase